MELTHAAEFCSVVWNTSKVSESDGGFFFFLRLKSNKTSIQVLPGKLCNDLEEERFLFEANKYQECEARVIENRNLMCPRVCYIYCNKPFTMFSKFKPCAVDNLTIQPLVLIVLLKLFFMYINLPKNHFEPWRKRFFPLKTILKIESIYILWQLFLIGKQNFCCSTHKSFQAFRWGCAYHHGHSFHTWACLRWKVDILLFFNISSISPGSYGKGVVSHS